MCRVHHLADRALHQRGGAGQRGEERPFLPERGQDVGRQHRIESGRAAQRDELGGSLPGGRIPTACGQRVHRVELPDRPVGGQSRSDVRHATEHPVGAEARVDGVHVREAVEERHHEGVRADRGLDRIERVGQVVGLRGQQHQVVLGLDGVARHAAHRQVEIAVRTADFQPMLGQQRRAGRADQKIHINAGFDQPRAEITTDATRAQEQQFLHRSLLTSVDVGTA